MPERNSCVPNARVRLIVIAIATCLSSAPAWSNPIGPQVVNGTASFTQAGNLLTVKNSSGAIINWNTFSIGANETTRFNQASANSSVLNRVLANDPSILLGTLSSNGKVWLVNPAGIMVGAGARIDVAGFIASTLNVRNEDFLAGRLNFGAMPNAGKVENNGQIITPSGGSVYLVAPAVTNNGIINAPNGDVILAAGQTVRIIDTGTPGVKVEITGSEGSATNLGQIVSEAGRIGMAGVLVKNSGNLNASSLVKDGGRIFLKASKRIELEPTSQISADGIKGGQIVAKTEENGQIDGELIARGSLSAQGDGSKNSGGSIETSAAKVDIRGINVSTGGGQWLIDPGDVTITGTGDDVSSGGSFSPGSSVNVDTLATALNNGTSVIIDTAGGSSGPGDITMSSAILAVHPNNDTTSLTLKAHRNIIIGDSSISSAFKPLGVTLNAHYADDAAPGAVQITNSSIVTNGGNLVIGGGSDPTTMPAIGYFDNSTWFAGVSINGSAEFTLHELSAKGGANGGGNITINGQGSSGALDGGNGVHIFGGAKIWTDGIGAINIKGKGASGYSAIEIADASNTTIATEAGALTLDGSGNGNNGGHGVYIRNGATVRTTSGSLHISGQGGSGYSGVKVENYGTLVTTQDGSIAIEGAGGADPYGSENRGIVIGDHAGITATGTGGIDLIGHGAASESDNYGVHIAAATVSVVDGSLSITGYGGDATGSGNKGVLLDSDSMTNYALVEGTGTGSISIQGYGCVGGCTSTIDNDGVSIRTHGVVRSAGGPITITGTGAGSSIGPFDNTGVYIGGAIAAKASHGSAPVIIRGTGSGSSYGVYIDDGGSIYAASRDVTLQSMSPSGVYINNAGQSANLIQSANLTVSGLLTLNGSPIVNAGGVAQFDDISAVNGSNVTIVAGSIAAGNVTTSALTRDGDSGGITLTANAGSITASSLSTGMVQHSQPSVGSTGAIILTARDNVTVTGATDTSIYADELGSLTGNAGAVSIVARTGAISAGNVNTSVVATEDGSSAGRGGDVLMTAGTGIVSGSIAAYSEAAGNASSISSNMALGGGNVTLYANAGNLQAGGIDVHSKVNSGGEISSAGPAGSIILRATDNILVSGGIDASSVNSGIGLAGTGGEISLYALGGSLTVNGAIDASSIANGSPSGAGGNVTLFSIADTTINGTPVTSSTDTSDIVTANGMPSGAITIVGNADQYQDYLLPNGDVIFNDANAITLSGTSSGVNARNVIINSASDVTSDVPINTIGGWVSIRAANGNISVDSAVTTRGGDILLRAGTGSAYGSQFLGSGDLNASGYRDSFVIGRVDGGTVRLVADGDIIYSGNISANGYVGNCCYLVADGGNILAQSRYGSINLTGASIEANGSHFFGGHGGNIEVSLGKSYWEDPLHSALDTTNYGGSITLGTISSVINIRANGSVSIYQPDGGNGGNIRISTALASTAGSITQYGQISANGGVGSSSSEGSLAGIGGKGGVIVVEAGVDNGSIQVGTISANGGGGGSGYFVDDRSIDNIRGGDGGRGGSVTVTAPTGSITVDSVHVSGGTSGAGGPSGNGGDGGTITLISGNDLIVNGGGGIEAYGGAGPGSYNTFGGGDGGNGGKVVLNAGGDISVSSSIDVRGGYGGKEYAGYHDDSYYGEARGGNGGRGGTLSIEANGDGESSFGNLDASGGLGGNGSHIGTGSPFNFPSGNGGKGGEIRVTVPNGALTLGAASTAGGDSELGNPAGNGGDGGAITLISGGTLSVLGACECSSIDASGGNAHGLGGGNGGSGGQVLINSSDGDVHVYGEIRTVGGYGGNASGSFAGGRGGDGGAISIAAGGSFTLESSVDSSGGRGGDGFETIAAGNGGDGGPISLAITRAGGTITLYGNTVTSSGGDGGDAGATTGGSGGNAAPINVSFAGDGTLTATSEATVFAQAGRGGSGSTAGANGLGNDVTIQSIGGTLSIPYDYENEANFNIFGDGGTLKLLAGNDVAIGAVVHADNLHVLLRANANNDGSPNTLGGNGSITSDSEGTPAQIFTTFGHGIAAQARGNITLGNLATNDSPREWGKSPVSYGNDGGAVTIEATTGGILAGGIYTGGKQPDSVSSGTGQAGGKGGDITLRVLQPGTGSYIVADQVSAHGGSGGDTEDADAIGGRGGDAGNVLIEFGTNANPGSQGGQVALGGGYLSGGGGGCYAYPFSCGTAGNAGAVTITANAGDLVVGRLDPDSHEFRNVDVYGSLNLNAAAGRVLSGSGSAGLFSDGENAYTDASALSIHINAYGGIGESGKPLKVDESPTDSLHFTNTSGSVFIASDFAMHVDEGNNSGGDIFLTSTGQNDVSLIQLDRSKGNVTASGNITYVADNFNIINSGSSSVPACLGGPCGRTISGTGAANFVQLMPYTAGRLIELDSNPFALKNESTLSLTQGELDRFESPRLIIGSQSALGDAVDAGSISIGNFNGLGAANLAFAPMASGGVDNIELRTGGDLSFAAVSVGLAAPSITVNAGGNVNHGLAVADFDTSTYNGNISVTAGGTIGSNVGSISLKAGTGAVNLLANGIDPVDYGGVYLQQVDAGSLLARSTGGGNIVLTSFSSINLSGANDALVIDAGTGNFINNNSGNPFHLTDMGARWLIYSTDPGPGHDILGGVALGAPDFKQYNASYGTALGQATGNGLIYSLVPDPLTVSLAGPFTQVYSGGTGIALVANDFTVTGMRDADTATIAPMVANYDNKNAATATKTVTAAGIAIGTASEIGSNASVYGYVLGNTVATDSASTVNPLAATLTGSRSYDGSSNVAGSILAASNLIAGDTLTFAGSGTLAAKHAGNQSITGFGTLTPSNSNYTVAGASGSVTIGALALTLTAPAVTKTYDGGTGYTVQTVDLAALSGQLVGGDSVNAATIAYANKNAGVGTKSVTLNSAAINDSNGGANYSVTLAGNSTSTINPLALTLTAPAVTKTYDGGIGYIAQTADLTALSGQLVGGDTVNTATIAYANKNAGIGSKVVNFNAATISDGNGGANYLVTFAGNSTSTINPLAVTLTAPPVTKPYDGGTSYTAQTADLTALSGQLVGGDTVNVATIAYANRNAGVGTKSVTLNTAAISDGNGGANYSVTLAGNSTSTINPLAMTLTAPAVSKTYDGGTGYTAQTADLTALSGQLVGGDTASTATIAYANKNAGAGNKAVNFNAAAISDGNAGANYTLTLAGNNTSTITPAPLTVTATGQNKVYDATTGATVTLADNRIGGDLLSLGYTGATFADKTVGTTKPVTVGGINVTGADAGNYTFNAGANTAADISSASLTVSGVIANNKVYDATTAATLNTAGASVTPLAGDTVTLTVAAASASFADKNAGSAKPVTASGFALGGSDGGNYTAVQQTGLTANIAQALLAVNGVIANNKVYNATTAATLNTSGASVTPFAGDTVSLSAAGANASFADKNAGTAKPVTTVGFSIGSADAGNYALVQPSGLKADITPAALTLSSLSFVNKVYDATTAATVSGGSLDGVYSGDTVTVAGSGSFADKNAGTAKPVSVASLSLIGADAANYTVATPSGTFAANITPKPLSTWVGSADGLWSASANWDHGVVPDLGNVLAVSIPGGGANKVTYDATAGSTAIQTMDSAQSLVFKGGNLTLGAAAADSSTIRSGATLELQSGGNLNTVGNLAAANYLQSGGALSGSGNLTVSNSFSQSGGSIALTGTAIAAITHASGDLLVGSLSAPSVKLTAQAGGIAQGGAIVTAGLITQSATGTSLTDAGNRVSSFTAGNSGSGNIALTNTGVLSIVSASNTGGGIVIDNAGKIMTIGPVSAPPGSVSIHAHSPLEIGAGGVTAGGNIDLLAGATVAGGDDLTIAGPVSSSGSGATITLFAGDNIAQNANVTSGGGAISATAQSGSISMAANAVTSSGGGKIGYKASAGDLVLSSLNAGSGAIDIASGGSILTASGVTGPTLIGGSAIIDAAGSANLTTKVQLLDVNVGGKFSITDFITGTVITDVPAPEPLPTTTIPIVNQLVSTVVAATQQSTQATTTQSTTQTPPSVVPTSAPTGAGPLLLSNTTQTTGGTTGTFGGTSSATTDTSAPTSAGASGGTSTSTASTASSSSGDKPAETKKEEKKDEKRGDEKKKEEAAAKKEEKPKRLAVCS